jgi:Na+-driven multidrug efflux pump
VGFLAAGFAPFWMGLFTTEPAVAQAGITYLRIVGPSYAFFGMGLALFFASQGAGRIVWPFLAVTSRLFVVAVGGWLAVDWFAAGVPVVFAVVAVSFVVVGVTVFGVVRTRIAW